MRGITIINKLSQSSWTLAERVKGNTMTRIEIYNKMKELGMKHYIMSAKHYSDEKGRYTWIETERMDKCHYTDESFEKEINRLRSQGYDFFDVIHNHE